MHTVITNHVYRPLDTSPETTALALSRLEPLHPLHEALMALGLGRIVSIERTEPPASGTLTPVRFSVVWPLPDGHLGRVSWTVAVDPRADSGALLSVAVGAGTEEPAGASQLVAAWPLIGQIVDAQTTRLLRSVAAFAEDLEDEAYR
jgi:hypothetical protein